MKTDAGKKINEWVAHAGKDLWDTPQVWQLSVQSPQGQLLDCTKLMSRCQFHCRKSPLIS